MALDESMQARISGDCPYETQQILYHAWAHDVTGLKALLSLPGTASSQDPSTGEAPLHAAIRACGPATAPDDENQGIVVEEAVETVRELFFCGAIWNDVDNNNETPGCVAARLGRKELYELCVEAGVRAELLFGLLDGYEQLSSGPDEAEEEDDGGDEALSGENGEAHEQDAVVVEAPKFVPPKSDDEQVKSEEYLRANLTYSDGKLVDNAGNGVMMAWETDIMRRSVDALLSSPPREGARILNIGFGMGIIDTMFAESKPARHHIIEAHPAVLEHISKPDSKFGSAWESNGYEDGANKVFRGKWQDIVPGLIENGELYDAIYFDTFAENYSQLRMFFTEFVPGILDEHGKFSFFNGLGADRQICYDVYIRVAEAHLADAGLDVDWDDVGVDMKGLEEAGKGEWDGVRRRYWTLESKLIHRTRIALFSRSN
jgi:type IV protein arginine methyltransferase